MAKRRELNIQLGNVYERGAYMNIYRTLRTHIGPTNSFVTPLAMCKRRFVQLFSFSKNRLKNRDSSERSHLFVYW